MFGFTLFDHTSSSFRINQQYAGPGIDVGEPKGGPLNVLHGKLGPHNRVQKLMEGLDGELFTLKDALGRFRKHLGDKATKKLVAACLCVALSISIYYVCFSGMLIIFQMFFALLMKGKGEISHIELLWTLPGTGGSASLVTL